MIDTIDRHRNVAVVGVAIHRSRKSVLVAALTTHNDTRKIHVPLKLVFNEVKVVGSEEWAFHIPAWLAQKHKLMFVELP